MERVVGHFGGREAARSIRSSTSLSVNSRSTDRRPARRRPAKAEFKKLSCMICNIDRLASLFWRVRSSAIAASRFPPRSVAPARTARCSRAPRRSGDSPCGSPRRRDPRACLRRVARASPPRSTASSILRHGSSRGRLDQPNVGDSNFRTPELQFPEAIASADRSSAQPRTKRSSDQWPRPAGLAGAGSPSRALDESLSEQDLLEPDRRKQNGYRPEHVARSLAPVGESLSRAPPRSRRADAPRVR